VKVPSSQGLRVSVKGMPDTMYEQRERCATLAKLSKKIGTCPTYCFIISKRQVAALSWLRSGDHDSLSDWHYVLWSMMVATKFIGGKVQVPLWKEVYHLQRQEHGTRPQQ